VRRHCHGLALADAHAQPERQLAGSPDPPIALVGSHACSWQHCDSAAVHQRPVLNCGPCCADDGAECGKHHVPLHIPCHGRRHAAGKRAAADVRAAAPCGCRLLSARRPEGDNLFVEGCGISLRVRNPAAAACTRRLLRSRRPQGEASWRSGIEFSYRVRLYI